ncbi:hypothetical protein GLYMA_04G203233v4 [Glycine max]|nr:hypothetical protein GLYMA_04G203233v4 [Glycine max]KAH1112336.1 hypothetical protein GYH30_010559 [Glycine max]
MEKLISFFSSYFLLVEVLLEKLTQFSTKLDICNYFYHNYIS